MTLEQLVAKQQLQIENYKKIYNHNERLKEQLRLKCTAVGAPLNDNVLEFNDKQLLWCSKVLELIQDINEPYYSGYDPLTED